MTVNRFLLRFIYLFGFLLLLSITLVYHRLAVYDLVSRLNEEKSDNNNNGESSYRVDFVQSENNENPSATHKMVEQLQQEIARLQSRLTHMEHRQNELQTSKGTSFVKKYDRVKQLPYSQKKRILITGGAGFVGSHLVDRLITAGHDVIVADNFYTGRRQNIEHWLGHPNFELLHHDVVNPLYVEVDQIYHLASPASPPHYMMNAVKTIKTNTVGTINMLGLAKRVGARILVASTSEVYGDPIEHPQSEAYWGHVNPIGPRSCYDEGKRVAESLTVAYEKQEKLEVRIARIFNTYGPRMYIKDGRVVSNFISQALQGQRLTVYGAGDQTRSFQYVSDLVDGLVALMEANYSRPVNLGNPREYTINQFATMVLDLVHGHTDTAHKQASMPTHSAVPDRYQAFLEFHPSPQDDPQRRRPNISLAAQVLHWSPTVSVVDGLSRTIEYFRGELQLSLGRQSADPNNPPDH